MRNFLVTGGSQGIGKATVEILAEQGNQITFTYMTRETESVLICDKLRDRGLKVNCFQLNLLDKSTITGKLHSAMERFGAFDGIVHNAGKAADDPFYFLDEKKFWDPIDTSLNSFFYINKACLGHMIGQRWGRIVTLASIAGESGNRGQTNYAAAKGAVISATKSLARELAGKGILCNSVSPGIIDTGMTQNLPKDEILRLIPVGRYGKPEEVAHVIKFLLSDEASYINGEVIRVNGGFYT